MFVRFYNAVRYQNNPIYWVWLLYEIDIVPKLLLGFTVLLSRKNGICTRRSGKPFKPIIRWKVRNLSEAVDERGI